MHNVSFDNITISTRYYNQTWWGGAEPIYVVATPRTATTQVGQGRATAAAAAAAAADTRGEAGAAGGGENHLLVEKWGLGPVPCRRVY